MQESDVQAIAPEQINAFHRNGYLVVPDLLTNREVEEFIVYENQPKPDGWRQDLRHHVDDDAWRHIAAHPNVTRIARRLLGGARPMIVQTMYLEKQPAGDKEIGGQGIALHQDLHYLPCEPATLLACWIALSDTDGGNGGLCVVPSSNHDGLYSTHKTSNVDDHDAWEIEYEMRDRSGREWTERMYSFEIDGLDAKDILQLEVPKGSGVFFTGLTIHGSYANRSKDRARRAFATHYVAEGTWVDRVDVQQLTPVE